MSQIVVCQEHGEGVAIVFPKAWGQAGCPLCHARKRVEELEDRYEEDEEV